MIHRFQQLLLVSRVMTVLQTEGMKDKTLAEYIITLCK